MPIKAISLYLLIQLISFDVISQSEVRIKSISRWKISLDGSDSVLQEYTQFDKENNQIKFVQYSEGKEVKIFESTYDKYYNLIKTETKIPNMSILSTITLYYYDKQNNLIRQESSYAKDSSMFEVIEHIYKRNKLKIVITTNLLEKRRTKISFSYNKKGLVTKERHLPSKKNIKYYYNTSNKLYLKTVQSRTTNYSLLWIQDTLRNCVERIGIYKNGEQFHHYIDYYDENNNKIKWMDDLDDYYFLLKYDSNNCLIEENFYESKNTLKAITRYIYEYY